MLALCKIIEES